MVRKRRKRKSPPGIRAASEAEIFNPALEGLKALKKARPPSEPQASPAVARGRAEPDEASFFLQAVADVKPLAQRKRTVARTPNVEVRPAHPAPDDDLDALTRLSDLVAGNADMDITFSDEYIEGAVPGFSQKLMKSLREGKFAVQDHVDLHGLTQQEAEIRVREFLRQSYLIGLRCILVVHGRGLNSENHIPVLKERLPAWLSRGPAKKMVLAFSTARPYDGGTGAVYVLLRKAGPGAGSLAGLRR